MRQEAGISGPPRECKRTLGAVPSALFASGLLCRTPPGRNKSDREEQDNQQQHSVAPPTVERNRTRRRKCMVNDSFATHIEGGKDIAVCIHHGRYAGIGSP